MPARSIDKTTGDDTQLTALYICYWSLNDPLCLSQCLTYIRRLTRNGYKIALVTFEQEKYSLDPDKGVTMQRELMREGILWYPLTYHKRLPLLATAWDCLQGIVMGLYINARFRPRIVHSRASIAAFMGLALSKLTGMKFLYDADSRLSEEYVDTGYWKRESLAYRLMAWVEDKARKNAFSIIVLTEKLKQDFIDEFKVTAPITVIPCCVDAKRFKSDSEARTRRRDEARIGSDRMLIYVGKIGPRYQIKEMLEFFRAAVERIGQLRLVILTGDLPDSFVKLADGAGLDRDRYMIFQANREEVVEWLSAADAGLAFVKSANCERGSSPIKVGEYLATGLPVIITEAIGDYSDMIEQHHLGVVIRDHSRDGYCRSADQLKHLWEEGDELNNRCRDTAMSFLSLDQTGVSRYLSVYNQLLVV